METRDRKAERQTEGQRRRGVREMGAYRQEEPEPRRARLKETGWNRGKEARAAVQRRRNRLGGEAGGRPGPCTGHFHPPGLTWPTATRGPLASLKGRMFGLGPVVGREAQRRGQRKAERKDRCRRRKGCRKQEKSREKKRVSQRDSETQAEWALEGGGGGEKQGTPHTEGQGVGWDGTRASEAVP